ncbi:hypothetical protein BLOT_015979 [Blomia tropicalis]|nr:hypothetical protein BLOT_015979 [Blomia tropicalis]
MFFGRVVFSKEDDPTGSLRTYCTIDLAKLIQPIFPNHFYSDEELKRENLEILIGTFLSKHRVVLAISSVTDYSNTWSLHKISPVVRNLLISEFKTIFELSLFYSIMYKH